MPAFLGRWIAVNPQGEKNLNRAFPARPNGTTTALFGNHPAGVVLCMSSAPLISAAQGCAASGTWRK